MNRRFAMRFASRIPARVLAPLLALALTLTTTAHAHDAGGPDPESGIDAHATTDGNLVEARAIVPGTVATLKADLYRLEQWPTVFTDARSLTQNADGTWAVDFIKFGHAHDFRITRTPAGVVFEIAAKDHGVGRFEYALEPIDATSSRLRLRLLASTPPQLTQTQMIDLLRAKAQTDLDDFSKRANERIPRSTP